MKRPDSLKKWFPLLLILSIGVIVAGDQMRLGIEPPAEKIPGDTGVAFPEDGHVHGGEEDPHADPEKNRRMGIYHYNEGNKAFAEGKLEEAIGNYKMALHHDKNSQATYINLSTTYLRSGRMDEALAALQTLEGINPNHPLLFYNLACYHSRTGNLAAGLTFLKQSVAHGYTDTRSFDTDPDLENLRRHPGFKEWIESGRLAGGNQQQD